MGRANEAIIIIGRKRTGKSTLANKIAKGYSGPRRRTLIIDVNGSPAYAEHEQINYEKLKRYRSGGIYKFYDPNHERMFDFLTSYYGPQYDDAGNLISKKLFHGLMVFEDCTKYIDSNPSQAVKTFLVDHRMWDADMLFTFHSLAMVPPFFWRMTSRVILLKTQDTMSPTQRRQFENKIPNWKKIERAWEEVDRSSNPFEHRVIETLI